MKEMLYFLISFFDVKRSLPTLYDPLHHSLEGERFLAQLSFQEWRGGLE